MKRTVLIEIEDFPEGEDFDPSTWVASVFGVAEVHNKKPLPYRVAFKTIEEKERTKPCTYR
jgi:hypothetical protein